MNISLVRKELFLTQIPFYSFLLNENLHSLFFNNAFNSNFVRFFLRRTNAFFTFIFTIKNTLKYGKAGTHFLSPIVTYVYKDCY